MMTQEDEIRKYSGEWILLFDDQIIDHSVNLEDMLKLVDEKYPNEQYSENRVRISRVPTGTPREFIQL